MHFDPDNLMFYSFIALFVATAVIARLVGAAAAAATVKLKQTAQDRNDCQ
jgi:hypothetical protein